MRFEFDLPIPPSTNGAYANKGEGQGRVKTLASRVYTQNAIMALLPHLNANKAYCDKNIMQRMGAGYGKQIKGRPNIKSIAAGIKGPRPSYYVKYIFHFPDNSVRDIFNFEKLLTDILVTVGFMIDDQFIDYGEVVRGNVDKDNPRVHVIIDDITTTK